MLRPLIVIHNGPTVPLPVQAIVEAFAQQQGTLACNIGIQSLRNTNFEAPILSCESASVLFFDVPPWSVEASTLKKLPSQVRVGWVFSALFSAQNTTALTKWQKQDGSAAWSEPGCAICDQVPGLRPIVLPPLAIMDTSPYNPVRRACASPRICLPMPPIPDHQGRVLQRESLMCKSNGLHLSLLWPAEDIRELCERFFGYDVFYIPGENGRPQWRFDLSCLLCSGAVVAGCVPESVSSFCQPTSCFTEAVQFARYATVRTLRFNKLVMNKLRQDFMQTLNEGGLHITSNTGVTQL